MKKLLTLCLSLLLCFALSVNVWAAVDLDEPDYVVDDANVLSDTTEQLVRTVNTRLEQNCQGAQMVVITTKYAPEDTDQQELASEIFNSWNVGDADENNGFVLVLYTEVNGFWLECGDDILDACYDELSDIFVEEDSDFLEYLEDGRYDKAVEEALEDVEDVLSDHYHVSSKSSAASSSGTYSSTSAEIRSSSGASTLLLAVVIFLLFNRRYKRRRGIGFLPYLFMGSAGRRNYRSTYPRDFHGHDPGHPAPHPGDFDPGHPSSRPGGFNASRPGGFGSSFRSGGGGHSGSGFGSSSHSGGSFRSGGGHSGGGFGSSSHSGGGFHGGGGHSGGGFGKR